MHMKDLTVHGSCHEYEILTLVLLEESLIVLYVSTWTKATQTLDLYPIHMCLSLQLLAWKAEPNMAPISEDPAKH